jgi:DNA processing protein
MAGAAPRDDDLAALVALASLPGVGPATLRVCLENDPVDAWHAAREGRAHGHPALGHAVRRGPSGASTDGSALVRAAAEVDAAELLARHLDAGISVAVLGGPGYPERLLDDPDPPVLVFAAGSLTALDGPTVAIVGTRNATRLGCDTAASLSLDLARRGIAIVSGLALGIDGAAHRPLVDRRPEEGLGPADGRPVAVVAAGLDHRYPRRHARLHDDVARIGAVVSEVPCGVGPARWRFPARNRIIAGLADALVVVESRSAGGSMLTVGDALARDVPVLAVPGHPSAVASAGALDLLCDGAIPVRDAQDVLVAIGMGGAEASAPTSSAEPEIDPSEAAVLAELGRGPRLLGELIGATGMGLSDVSSVLLSLERSGRIERSGGWFELCGAAPAQRSRAERGR